MSKIYTWNINHLWDHNFNRPPKLRFAGRQEQVCQGKIKHILKLNTTICTIRELPKSLDHKDLEQCSLGVRQW